MIEYIYFKALCNLPDKFSFFPSQRPKSVWYTPYSKHYFNFLLLKEIPDVHYFWIINEKNRYYKIIVGKDEERKWGKNHQMRKYALKMENSF